MPYTAFAQVPIQFGSLDAVNPATTAEAPDAVNGNTFVHTSKRMLMIRNLHDAKYISCQPVVQRTINEGDDTLTITAPTPTQIGFGEVGFVGPLSATNFKKTSDGKVYFNWALEGGGDIVVADVEVTVIDLP